ncbi:MAG: hypothetical protein ACREEV_18460, partial [Dongiaceae bacterium]
GVLFVTGYARPARIGALAPGDRYLLKPYAPAALGKALRQLSNTTPAGSNGWQESAPPGRSDPSVATDARSVLTQP